MTQAAKEAVALAESFIARLFALDHRIPARALLPTVGRYLGDIDTLLRGTHDEVLRRRLTAAGGYATALGGRLALDRGDGALAHHCWDNAVTAARDTQDTALLACVLMHTAHAATERGDHKTARQLAHHAADYAPDEPRTQTWIALQAAEAAAQCGESAALDALKHAHNWGLEIGPSPVFDDTAPPWARFIDHAYLWAKTAHVHTLVSDADNAHHAAVRAFNTLSTNRVKTHAIVLAEAAYTFAHVGDAERAHRHAANALHLAETLEVPAATQRLHELTALLPKPLDQAGRELQHQLRHARTRHPPETMYHPQRAKTDHENNHLPPAPQI